MQKMFLPTSEISAILRENARNFWENQEKVLDSMQALANAWFDRRHTGTQAAREAAERMCAAWASGAFEKEAEPERSGPKAQARSKNS